MKTNNNNNSGIGFFGMLTYEYTKLKFNLCFWIVRHCIPKRLIYLSAVQVGAYATTGKYGSTIVPEVTLMECIGRYGKDYIVEE